MTTASEHVRRLENELMMSRARERRAQQEGVFFRGKLDQLAGALENTSRSASAMCGIAEDKKKDIKQMDQQGHKLALSTINAELGMAKTMLWRSREMDDSCSSEKENQISRPTSGPIAQSDQQERLPDPNVEPSLFALSGWQQSESADKDVKDRSGLLCKEAAVAEEDSPPRLGFCSDDRPSWLGFCSDEQMASVGFGRGCGSLAGQQQGLLQLHSNMVAAAVQEEERRKFARVLKAALDQQRESMEKRQEARLREMSDLLVQLRKEHRRRLRTDEVSVVKKIFSSRDSEEAGEPIQGGDQQPVPLSPEVQAFPVVDPVLCLSLKVPLLDLTVDVRLVASPLWNSRLHSISAWLALDSQTSLVGGALRISRELVKGRFSSAFSIAVAVFRLYLTLTLWYIIHSLRSLVTGSVRQTGTLS